MGKMLMMRCVMIGILVMMEVMLIMNVSYGALDYEIMFNLLN